MLRDYNRLLVPDEELLRKISNNFYTELKNSYEGKATSMPFIINPLGTKRFVRDNETYQVMVIGGSVCQTALAVVSEGKIALKQESLFLQPIFKSKDDFIHFVAQNTDKETGLVALNFAYPLDPILREGRIDGILRSGTKEHVFAGLTGMAIGDELERFFYEKYKRKIKFLVANDAICLIMSGLNCADWKNLAGGIVGTGVNFSFFLSMDKIVNLESGNFDKFPISIEAHAIDNKSSNKGFGVIEKETSGRYLYEHYNLIIQAEGLDLKSISSTQEMSLLAQQDNSISSGLAQALIKKSACLTAVQIAGICKFKQCNMNFVMEGSLFRKGYGYKEQVSKFVNTLVPETKVSFLYVEDSSLRGAAALAFR